MKISAIVCTYNRARQLGPAVESLMRQTLSAKDYEIIVVDNASTDETRLVAQAIAQQAGNVRYVYEAELGLSNARNRGVEEARGEIVAFMDDDAVADSEWLMWLLRAFDREGGRLACVGGRVRPVWETERPNWLPESLLGWLSMVDYGDEPRPCNFPKEFIVGCNMAFRREHLLEYGGFDSLLGRSGGDLGGSEETALQRTMHQRGGVIFYEARAVVHHFVPRERLSRMYFLRRGFSGGISEMLSLQTDGQQASYRALIKNMATTLLGMMVVVKSLLTMNQQEVARGSMTVAYALGAVFQWIRWPVTRRAPATE